jgi:sugar lactone lactonase YvrE
LKISAFFLAFLGLVHPFSAATSTSWDTSGFADFLKGRSSGLALSADGSLQLGPAQRWEVHLNQPALWSIASAPDGSIYAATGHSGRAFRVSPDGRPPAQIWSAEQAEVFAVAVDPQGTVFAGSSPNGGIYRIEGGKAREIWRSPAKYIWTIRIASDGTLYVGTGENGRIYRIDREGKGDVYYETGQSNVTALALGPNQHLYAGTDPNGLLYDITGPRQGTILYDSSLPEIRAIAVDPNGSVYACAMGGALSTRSGATNTAATATSSTSGVVTASSPTVITVTEAQTGSSAKPADNDAQIKVPSDPSRSATATSSTAATNTGAVTETSGVERSAIYRIAPGGIIETLRSSKEDNVYDVILDGDSLLFSTDDHGRIYRWRNGRSTLLAEAGDGETTRLLKTPTGFEAAASNPARLLAFDSAADGSGWFQSPVHDTGSIAHWGHLRWHGTGSGVVFRTRSGNSARPDETWSKWSAPLADSGRDLIASPAARFVQWRGEWSSGSTATLSSVSLPFLPQNQPPVMRSVTVSSIIGTNPAKSSASASSASSSYSITVTDTGEAPAASTSSTASQVASRLQATQTQISWQADDPDGDKLVYSLYFRPEEATQWQLVRSRITENTILLDPDVFADGRYLFRVVASDSASNAPEYAKQTELVSTPVVIDNTPPLVTLGTLHRVDTTADVDVTANDAASPLRRCEYSLDAGFWQPVEAVDGITDSQQERFHIHLEKLRPGEHLLVVRVYDSVGNAGLARSILK